ncbi:uncharacterized protein G2W53_013163 [Senna tora]|uniref:Uncharacterized protein n=1 Tax=Senna tora TaxID=362788 RepID=A0A834U219_9FABA|nr:uncharacterized protein G2W53_013163 [Senna tora]
MYSSERMRELDRDLRNAEAEAEGEASELQFGCYVNGPRDE